MTEWYVKDLSKLTGVSVQTLHHYDRIGLLKPSLRLPNGYRVYLQADLFRLQHIIALKFFGFDLSQIKELLGGTENAVEHLEVQSKILEKQANHLLNASEALKAVIAEVAENKSIHWKSIIDLIEVYRMTTQLENSWVKEIFTPDELKQYATLQTEWKTQKPTQKAVLEQEWKTLIEAVNKNLNQDPKSAVGIELGKTCMEWVNRAYGKENAQLRTKMFEKGFGEGKGLEEAGLTPKSVAWLDKAMDAYWRDRIYGTLNQAGAISSDQLLTLWNQILVDMYGDDTSRQQELYEVLFKDENLSEPAKIWLRTL